MNRHELVPRGSSPPAKRAKLDPATSETAVKPGSNNSPDDLIGDIVNITDSSNLLGGFGLNSTAPPQPQQTQRHPMINLSTCVPSLQPTAVSMGSPGMVTQSQTQQMGKQQNKSGPYGSAAQLPLPSTLQFLTQGVSQPSSSTQQGLQQQQPQFSLNPPGLWSVPSQQQFPPNPPGPGGQMSDPERRKQIQQQLVLLLHAHKCQRREKEQAARGDYRPCTLPHCRTMKGVLNHMTECKAGRSCTYPHCASSRQIISHWKNCQRSECPVCLPLKHSSVDRPSQGTVSYNTTDAVRSYFDQQSSAVPAEMSADLAQSRVPYPIPIPNIVSQPTQQWHQHVPPDLREHLVRKLVEAIYPVQDPMALQDRRVPTFVQYAMKIEKAMFEAATNREEYYQLLAEKIYQVRKELEERRMVKSEIEKRIGDSPEVCLRQLQLSSDPTEWTEDQVYRWAEWTLLEFGLTSVNLPALRGINGHQLCSFDHQQFLQLGINPRDAFYLQECLDVFNGGASKNKTLNTTSHDQDKEKLLSHPGVDEPVETEHARTSTSTSPKQEPFKTESMLLFEQAMKEGYIEVSIIKCLLLGTAGVGKTCLLHLLLNMLPPHLRQSTACIEQAIRAICMKYGIDSQGEWQKVDSDGLRDRLAGSVSCHQKEDDADVSAVPASDTSLPFDQEEEATDFPGPESYTMEDIVKRLEEEETQLGRLQDMTWVYLVDSGGQPQFHELLTAFFRNALIGIFVHKLSERLDDHPHVKYFDKEGKECGTGYRSPLNNRDLFQHCIQTVQSLPYTTKQSTCPRLGVVGTFRDEEHLCTGESRIEKNKQLCEILRPISDSVLFLTGMQEVIFPVNAISPNDEDKKIARKLKRKIESLKPPPEKLPLKWYGLELELEKEAAQKNRWVFTTDECLQVAKRLHFPSDEALHAALVHLDKLNIFLYYPSVLPELVFCSPCVLLDKISELVEESYRLKHGPDPYALVEGKFSDFCNKGLITAQLLQGYPKHYTEFFTQAHLLKLFESLLIVAPIDHDTYFMPSLLDVLKRSDFERPSCGCQLIISFKGRYAPLGLFSSLVAFLLSDKTEPNPWVVFGDTSKLYRNHITFYLDSYPGSVVLIDSAAFFEVYLILDCSDLPDLYKDTCRYVSHTIEMGLNEAIKARNFQNVRYHKAISCPCAEGCHTLHPALLQTCSGTEFWKCTQRRGTCGKLDECHRVWVKNYIDNYGAGTESCPAVVKCKRKFSVIGEGSKGQAETSTDVQKPIDLKNVYEDLVDIAHKWYDLGLQLELTEGTLETIKSDNPENSQHCLRKMLSTWLKIDLRPTWQTLCAALRSRTVGAEKLASDLEVKQQMKDLNIVRQQRAK